jgi:hypothetical protein
MRLFFIFIFTFFLSLDSYSQNLRYFIGFYNENRKSVSFDFKLVNNLIIIPLRINASDTLFFILDSGVKPTLLTNFRGTMRFSVAGIKTIEGLGKGKPIVVIETYKNDISVADKVLLTLQNVYVLKNDRFKLSKKMGTQINGIIGSVIFENFVVRIDYIRRRITLYNPEKFKAKRFRHWIKFPLKIYNSKPYVELPFRYRNDSIFKALFLIDLGASDALWLLPDSTKFIHFDTTRALYYVGQGLNGDIYGYYVRGKELFFDYKRNILKNFLITIPDTSCMKFGAGYDIKGRNGTIGAEILRRFDIILDYSDKMVFFRRNYNFRDNFYLDLSGLELETPYPGLPIYEIFYIQKGSPADKAGLREGDELVRINHVNAAKYTLNELILLFRSRVGRKIKLEVSRNGQIFKTVLILQDYRL